MTVLLFIVKSLIILGVNIAFGYIICIFFHGFFFYHRKVILFGKYPVPFTPGLVYRKKEQLIHYLYSLIDNYFEYVKRDYRERNTLNEYEHRVYHELFPIITDFCERDWIPGFLEDKLHDFLSRMLWAIIRKFSRSILPTLLREWDIYTKLDIVDLKLDVSKIRQIFDDYFYQYFMWFNIVFFAIVGVLNMVMFMILS